MPIWEYRVVELSDVLKAGFGRVMGESLSYKAKGIQQAIGRDGEAGWELVSVVPTIGHQGTSKKLLLFFKRPKE